MATVISSTEALSLAETLGTLLAAIVDAQAQSARATVEFVREVGFEDNSAGTPGETLRTVRFRYHKLDENDKRSEFVVELPLLGMVDIPSIAIKKATIAFDYEITSAQSTTATGTTPTVRPGLFERLPRPALLKGRVADQRSQTQARSTLRLNVELEKADLPPSLERVLDILTIATRDEKAPPPP
jgi:hypothetical protein